MYAAPGPGKAGPPPEGGINPDHNQYWLKLRINPPLEEQGGTKTLYGSPLGAGGKFEKGKKFLN